MRSVLGRPRPKGQKEDNQETAPLLGNTSTKSTSTSTSRIRDEEATVEFAHGKVQTAVSKQPASGYRELFSVQSSINLLAYALLALHSIAYDQLLPIFMHHPRQQHAGNPEVHLPFKFAGGFGINSQEIGFLFTIYGLCGMLIQFFVFPAVARRFGILNCFKACAITFPIVCLLTPFTALLEKTTTQELAVFFLMFIKCFAVMFAFPCSTILLTNSATSLRVLGTLNGVATSVSALGRAAGPAIGGWTFSWGVKLGCVIIPWWTLAAWATLGAVPVWFLVEGEGFGGQRSDGRDGEGNGNLIDDGDQDVSRPAVPIAAAAFVENENAVAVVAGSPLSFMTSHSGLRARRGSLAESISTAAVPESPDDPD